MSIRQQIRTAQSYAADPREAVREFHAAVAQPDMELVLFFCSSEYDLELVAAEMARLFVGVQVVGCTTAGEIGPAGYRQNSLTGASLPADVCTAVVGHIGNLNRFEMARGHLFAQSLLQQLQAQAPHATPNDSFAFLLIDGLSTREELVTRALQHSLGRIPIFGGSAGDGLRFGKTYVYYEGSFHTDSAVLILSTTSLPFTIFKTQHFISTNERMVVTAADARKRIVREINGLPAAEAYARLVGVDVDDLDPMRFAASPVVVLINGMDYVRAIQKVNPDGSLTFYCAIEEGLVLRVVHGVDLVENLTQTLLRVEKQVGMPQVVFGCDCVLRNLEIIQFGLKERVAHLLGKYNTVGFNTYGEQFGGVHVNQTFVGIAIGSVKESSDG